jgi:ABC-2 type transport system permease protein
MKFINAVAYREYRIRLTNPVLPLWDVLVPVVYLIVFGSSLESWIGAGVAHVGYATFFLGGVLAMGTFSIAMNSSYAFFEDLQSGMFHEMLTYPFARRDILFGKLLFNSAFGIFGALLLLLAGTLVLKTYHTTTSTLYLVLMFVSNLFYPTETLPVWIRWLAWANPITWQTDVLRYLTYGSEVTRLLQAEVLLFVIFVVVCFWLSNRSLNAPIE